MQTPPKVLEARRVAFSILIEGMQPYSFLRGLAWNDPDIGVEWPIPEGMELTLSEKDQKWPGLKEYKNR